MRASKRPKSLLGHGALPCPMLQAPWVAASIVSALGTESGPLTEGIWHQINEKSMTNQRIKRMLWRTVYAFCLLGRDASQSTH